MKWTIALGFAAMTVPATAAAAPMACGLRAEMVSHLAERYKEFPVAVGLAGNGGLFEVLTSANGVTWTIIVTMPNGVACLVAAGQDWQKREPPLNSEPST